MGKIPTKKGKPTMPNFKLTKNNPWNIENMLGEERVPRRIS